MTIPQARYISDVIKHRISVRRTLSITSETYDEWVLLILPPGQTLEDYTLKRKGHYEPTLSHRTFAEALYWVKCTGLASEY